jgi:hypothetical protein
MGYVVEVAGTPYVVEPKFISGLLDEEAHFREVAERVAGLERTIGRLQDERRAFDDLMAKEK